MTDTSKIIAAVATVWDALGETHADLPEVTVVISTTGTPHDLRYPDDEGKIVGAPTPPELPVPLDTIHQGGQAIVEHVIHVATHALCRVRGVSETSNRGRRHNRKFAAMAVELGGQWPDGQAPDPVKGFSPVPVTDSMTTAMAPYVAVVDKVVDTLGDLEETGKAPVKTRGRVSLECACGRTLQMGPRVVAQGPVICGVCREVFSER